MLGRAIAIGTFISSVANAELCGYQPCPSPPAPVGQGWGNTPFIDDYKSPSKDWAYKWNSWPYSPYGDPFFSPLGVTHPLNPNTLNTYGINPLQEPSLVDSGWTLYKRRMLLADGDGSINVNSASPTLSPSKLWSAYNPGAPYFILYNKYKSTLRFFIYTGGIAAPVGYQNTSLVIGLTSYTDRAYTSNGINEASYKKISNIFQFLQDENGISPTFADNNKVYRYYGSIDGIPGDAKWFVYDIPIAYDPTFSAPDASFDIMLYAATSQDINLRGSLAGQMISGGSPGGISYSRVFSSAKSLISSVASLKESDKSKFSSMFTTSDIYSAVPVATGAAYGISAESAGKKLPSTGQDNATVYYANEQYSNSDALKSDFKSILDNGATIAPMFGAYGAIASGAMSFVSSMIGDAATPPTVSTIQGTLSISGTVSATQPIMEDHFGRAGTSFSNIQYGAAVPYLSKSTSNTEALGLFGYKRKPKVFILYQRPMEKNDFYGTSFPYSEPGLNKSPSEDAAKLDMLDQTQARVYIESPDEWIVNNPSITNGQVIERYQLLLGSQIDGEAERGGTPEFPLQIYNDDYAPFDRAPFQPFVGAQGWPLTASGSLWNLCQTHNWNLAGCSELKSTDASGNQIEYKNAFKALKSQAAQKKLSGYSHLYGPVNFTACNCSQMPSFGKYGLVSLQYDYSYASTNGKQLAYSPNLPKTAHIKYYRYYNGISHPYFMNTLEVDLRIMEVPIGTFKTEEEALIIARKNSGFFIPDNSQPAKQAAIRLLL